MKTKQIEQLELIKIVNDLNQYLFDHMNEECSKFSYSTDGYTDVLLYDNVMLWNSLEDDRHFNEEENDYEPIKPFIINKLSDLFEENISIISILI